MDKHIHYQCILRYLPYHQGQTTIEERQVHKLVGLVWVLTKWMQELRSELIFSMISFSFATTAGSSVKGTKTRQQKLCHYCVLRPLEHEISHFCYEEMTGSRAD